MSLLYVDTARLGQACRSALQAQLDFSRLSADDPAMYGADFLRDGTRAWPDTQLRRYPGFQSWKGIESFKALLAGHFASQSPRDVFLANRSIPLVRAAARLMFRNCRNVLTSDLNWPHWQAIVAKEATRSGQRTFVVPLRDAVLRQQSSAEEVTTRLASAFLSNRCDGIFLPAVNNLGIRLPLAHLLSALKFAGRLRFVLIDASQSFCHVPEPTSAEFADITVTGSHKWLCGWLPLGIAVCGGPVIAEQLRAMLKSAGSFDLDDPLLRFSQQVCLHSVDNFGETVNVAPLFSANAAIRNQHTHTGGMGEQVRQQALNRTAIERASAGSSWSVVQTDVPLRSGIMLMQSSSPVIQRMDPETLRTRFREQGVALTAYSRGLIRISVPTETLSNQSIDVLAQAFRCIG